MKRIKGSDPFFASLQRKTAPFSAEPLKTYCDSCEEKIYVPVMKQLWSQDSVCMCVGFRPKIIFSSTRVKKANKQHGDWLTHVLCVFSEFLPGSAWSHGFRRATRTGRIHSEFCCLICMFYLSTYTIHPFTVTKQLVISNHLYNTELSKTGIVWGLA